MMNINKTLVILVLLSLVTTVIGSWLVFMKINDAKVICGSCQNTAPVVIKNDASSVVTLTIAPAEPRNIASGKIMLDITRI